MEPELMYLLQDFTKGKPRPYFFGLKGDWVEVIKEHGKTILVKNRDGETTAISKNLLSYTPPFNGPANKPEREEVEVKLPIQRPMHLGRTTTPVKKPVSKVKHVTKASTLF